MIHKTPTAKIAGGGSFKGAVNYARGLDKDHKEEKLDYENCRNINDIETAAQEMKFVADGNGRCEQPIYRYVISWPEGERPTPEQVDNSVDHIQKALGMEKNQAVYAMHHNTENYHVHVVVNRVDPETGKAVDVWRDYAKRDMACRELELKHDWTHDKGTDYEINDKGHIVKIDKDANRERTLDTKARDFETYRSEQSFKAWIKEQPARDAKATLDKGGNWQDLHRTLAKHGLEIQDQGKGFVIVDRENPDMAHAKASDMARFASKGNLEKQLGPYEPPAATTLLQESERTYKRDPDKRLDRREERKAERDKFYEQYRDYKTKYADKRKDAAKEINKTRKERLEGIKEEKRQAKELVKKQNIPGPQKRLLYASIQYEAAMKKEALDKQIEAKRQELNRQYPDKALSYKDYAHQEANKGNDVAVSVLRGLAYREQREAKIDKDREGATTEDGRETPPLMKTHPQPEKPNTTLENLDFRVSRHGNVSFYDRETGTEVFRDTGRQLLFTGIKKETPEAVEAGLRLAREKFGNNIELTGSEEFKKLATREAVKLGITITNKDMQPYQQQLRQERQQERQKQIQQTRGKDKGMER